MKKVLLVDRNSDFVQKVKKHFQKEYQIFSSAQLSWGMQRIFETHLDLILIGTNITEIDLFHFLIQVNRLVPGLPVIVLDKTHDSPRESKFKQFGAFDYLVRPESPADLTAVLASALAGSDSYECFPEGKILLNRIIGTSKATIRLKRDLLEFSQISAPVLLLGESGTGKDLAAWCIHHLSPRCSNRYITLNCGAIPGTLLESELFGVDKGAFTGAQAIPGKFEQSHRGTLFLDEISEMPPQAQVKLLRILESRTVTRLGGQRDIPIDCRIITASNRDLQAEIKSGQFRLDLLYRINTMFLEIQPLRNRREDVETLACHFLESSQNSEGKSFSPNAMEKLCLHSWPGNVRELKNVVERSLYCSTGEVIRSNEVRFFSG